ncbi:MAG: alpha/beta hydrolase [Pseudobutyrivibrio sp.]|nr:alpha/beta hydrolase [Pseudobutyrivibrio sp.]
MVEINKTTTLHDLNQNANLTQVKDILIGGGKGAFYNDFGNMTLQQLHEKQPTWDVDDMLLGIQRVIELNKLGVPYVFYPVKGKEETVQLIYVPAKKKKTDSYVVLCAGGGYGAVCTMVESLPVAAKLSELGIDSFCLNYTTFHPEDKKCGYIHKPLNDLAESILWIRNHSEDFDINPNSYYVGGFSAGGHLAAMWGTNSGSGKYGINNAKGLLLVYPLIAIETLMDCELKDLLYEGLLGEHNVNQVEEKCNINLNIDYKYPKTYLIQSIDDDTVPIVNADLMEDALNKKSIPNKIRKVQSGGHGFGLGSKLPDGTWVNEAVSFLDIISSGS